LSDGAQRIGGGDRLTGWVISVSRGGVEVRLAANIRSRRRQISGRAVATHCYQRTSLGRGF
jgi:hypothetical protein